MCRRIFQSWLVLCVVITTDSLECYNCTSAVSAEHCEKTQAPTTCAPLVDRCLFSQVRAQANSSHTFINKACATAQMCDSIRNQTQEACDGLSSSGAQVTSCTVTCCSSTLCNQKIVRSAAATLGMASGFLATLSCVVSATFILEALKSWFPSLV